MYRFTEDDRGVSESLGHILVFAIVITGIAIIVLFGGNILEDAKSQSNFQSIEQGLTVVQSDIKRVALEKNPVKVTRMHLEGGTIFSNTNSGMITIDYNGVNVYRNYTGLIKYDCGKDMRSISIEDGGLWKRYYDDGTDIIVSKPRIFTSDNTRTLLINVIRMNAEPFSSSGSGTLNIELRYKDTNVYSYYSTGGSGQDVRLAFETDYPNAWTRYLTKDAIPDFAIIPASPAPASGIDVTIKDVNELVIVEHVIDAKLYGVVV